MNRWTFFVVALVAAAAAGAGWFALQNGGDPVEADLARYDTIREFIDERGKTRLPKIHLITMPGDGRLEAIELVEGATVSEGQVVAQIVQRDLDLAVAEARAVVERLDAAIKENADRSVELTAHEQAQAVVRSMSDVLKAARERVSLGDERFQFAVSQLKRVIALATGPTPSKTKEELERTELAKIKADIDYKQDQLVYSATAAMYVATQLVPRMVNEFIDRKDLKELVLEKQRSEALARLEQIEENQLRGTMKSPVNGVVLERRQSNERFTTAGTVLLRIGELARLEVEADVLSQDVVDAQRGDRVEIYGPAIGKVPARGSIDRIFPAGFTKVSSLGVEQQRVKVIVRFEPEQLERLLSERGLGVDYRVRVKIFTAEKDRALVVPRSALFRGEGDDWRVFAIRGGRAKLAEVRVGLMNDEWAEIVEGLSEGEAVVRSPEADLVEGSRVQPVLRSKQ